jgi:hypothetical protein
MKNFIIIISILSCIAMPSASASGKLSFSAPIYHSGTGSSPDNPAFSLFVDEHIKGKFSYQSWTGTRPDTYFLSQHYLMYQMDPMLSVGVGPSYSVNPRTDISDTSLWATFEVKIW